MQFLIRHRWLWLALFLAVLLRIVVWLTLPRTGSISDESEYVAAATWLAYGRGFAWYLDAFWMRAPLYPLFVAAHIRIGGSEQWVWFTQVLLSLSHVLLVWGIARRMWPQQVPVADVAANLVAIALPLAIMPFTYLSETLSLTLFLCIIWLALGYQIAKPGYGRAFVLGLALGAAALTRGVTLAYIPVVAAWMYYGGGRLEPALMRQRLYRMLIMLGVCVLTIAPWSIYASRTFGGVILIDTTGAYNLLLRAHAGQFGGIDSTTTNAYVQSLIEPGVHVPDDTCLPHPGLLATQGARQQAITAEALCIITSDVGAYLARIPSEFVDFWQIRYTSAERFSDGFSQGALSPTYATLLFVFDDLWYALLIGPAIFGLWVMRRDGATRSQHELYLLWVILPIVLSIALFSITRFRIILLPFWAISAAGTLVWLRQRDWQALRAPVPIVVLVTSIALWSIVSTPLGGRVTGIPPSLLGPLPSAWQCTQLAYASHGQIANQTEYARMLHNDPWLMPIPEPLPERMRTVAPIVQQMWRGDDAAALALLDTYAQDGKERAILRGDIARRQGQRDEARNAFRTWYVEERNPLPWAWLWLPPTPTDRIDVGDGIDIGFIDGCYRPEYDSTSDRWGRWCGSETRLRFAQSATGFVQQLHLQYSVAGWPDDRLPQPPIEVWVEHARIGTIEINDPTRTTVVIDLPVLPAQSTIEVTLRGPAFVPSAGAFRTQNAGYNQLLPRYMLWLDAAWVK